MKELTEPDDDEMNSEDEQTDDDTNPYDGLIGMRLYVLSLRRHEFERDNEDELTVFTEKARRGDDGIGVYVDGAVLPKLFPEGSIPASRADEIARLLAKVADAIESAGTAITDGSECVRFVALRGSDIEEHTARRAARLVSDANASMVPHAQAIALVVISIRVVSALLTDDGALRAELLGKTTRQVLLESSPAMWVALMMRAAVTAFTPTYGQGASPLPVTTREIEYLKNELLFADHRAVRAHKGTPRDVARSDLGELLIAHRLREEVLCTRSMNMDLPDEERAYALTGLDEVRVEIAEIVQRYDVIIARPGDLPDDDPTVARELARSIARHAGDAARVLRARNQVRHCFDRVEHLIAEGSNSRLNSIVQADPALSGAEQVNDRLERLLKILEYRSMWHIGDEVFGLGPEPDDPIQWRSWKDVMEHVEVHQHGLGISY